MNKSTHNKEENKMKQRINIVNEEELEYGKEVILIDLGNGNYLGSHPIKRRETK